QIEGLLKLQEIGFGLPQLRVDLGRFNLREELAGLDAGPDVDIALLEIPAGPAVNDRVLNGLGRGRQCQASVRRSLWLEDVDGRHRLSNVLRGGGQGSTIPQTWNHTEREKDQEQGEQRNAER